MVLRLQVKFYYTIRELTNHVVELYALKALQGEVLSSGDPYTIPQTGFNHAWDAHGGGAYLHEHLIDDYVSCWQQGLSNGETDASVCDHGTSRWFNYYLEGAFWSVSQAPHMDGIYCECSRGDRVSSCATSAVTATTCLFIGFQSCLRACVQTMASISTGVACGAFAKCSIWRLRERSLHP